MGAAGAVALGAPTVAAAQSRSIDSPKASFQTVTPSAHDYRAALEALADYAHREITQLGLPGMTLSVTDAEGFTAILTLGFADLETREPIRPDHLFEIGSISKSFLALTILSLTDEGKIDLGAPIARYLPAAPLPPEPVSVLQLLSHTGGLPDSAPIFPRVPDGRLWTGFPPGSKFSYSNTGYSLLGAAVERVMGLSHQEAILRQVRARLGLADIAGDINAANRTRFPKAYIPADQSLAVEMPGTAMSEAKWDPETTPAGCIAATGEMMARYLRCLLDLGAGRGAPVLSDASARRFATPVTAASDFGPGAQYAGGRPSAGRWRPLSSPHRRHGRLHILVPRRSCGRRRRLRQRQRPPGRLSAPPDHRLRDSPDALGARRRRPAGASRSVVTVADQGPIAAGRTLRGG